MGLKFCSDFFWVRDFGKDFFWGGGGVDKKRNPGFSFLIQTIVSVAFTKERLMQKLSGILLDYYYYYYYFNWTFFGLRSGPLDFFWARV